MCFYASKQTYRRGTANLSAGDIVSFLYKSHVCSCAQFLEELCQIFLELCEKTCKTPIGEALSCLEPSYDTRLQQVVTVFFVHFIAFPNVSRALSQIRISFKVQYTIYFHLKNTCKNTEWATELSTFIHKGLCKIGGPFLKP